MLACMCEHEEGTKSAAVSGEIEVTPEMLAAGVAAAWRDGPAPSIVTDIVERTYVAMEKARRSIGRPRAFFSHRQLMDQDP